MMNLSFRKTQLSDFDELKALYINVAQNPRGIARNPTEILDEYIQSIVGLNENGGLSMIVTGESDALIGEIHAGQKGIAIFDHLLAHLTIGIHSNYQGKGVGKAVFKAFLNEVEKTRKDIYRVELESRASNEAGIRLYKRVGFIEEGRMVNQTRNLDGSHENGVMMTWYNPSYERLQDL